MAEGAHLKYLSIHLDISGRKVMAAFAPAGATNAITLDDFKQSINAAGFGAYSLDEIALANATAKYNAGIAFEIIVGDAVDGKFVMRISADQTAAYLTCKLPQGGAPVQMESVLQEAKSKGITVPLDLAAIENTLNKGGDNVLIAAGKAPANGADGRIETLLPSMSNRSPHLDEHGLADFRELGEVVTVHTGDALLRYIPPTSGEPGMNLSGKVIPAKPGKDIAFATKLNGTILDPNDPHLLLAAINGCPVLKKNEVSVEPVYTVKNVDLHTGNITFDGTIHVTEDVHTSMVIRASGDIHIDGTVDGALLDAGGDIVVKGGILGLSEQSDKFHSEIKCGGSCTARFVQNARISAGNGIFIHDFSMQSELSAGHQIIVGDQGSRKGHLIGGVARAAMLIKAQVVGSDTYVKTIVIAGADQRLHEQLKATTETRVAAERKLADIFRLLELARLNPSRFPPETIKAATATRSAVNAEIDMLRENEKDLQAEIDLASSAQVVAERQVFAGVEIRFGIKHQNIVADRQGGVFHLKDGELIFE